jgi:hypothetical protein
MREWGHISTHWALNEGEWSASRPDRLIRGERARGTHWTGGWVSPRAGLDTVVKKAFPAPAGTRIADHPARSLALATALSYPGSLTFS